MSASAVLATTALASIAANYVTQAQNMKSQLDINKKNIGMQLAYNADQVAVAQMNNQTQIDMANTAHQREVQDLRDAGLNPILSATGGNGAAMPSLGNPNGGAPELQAYRAENPLKELGTSAREIGRMMTDQYKAETDSAKWQAEILRQQALQEQMTTRLENTQKGLELDAYKLMQLVEVDPDGRIHIDARPDGRVQLDPQIVDAVMRGIKADIHNRRWSDLQGWIRNLSGGAQALGGAAHSGASTARIIKYMPK